jgi:hypothetical protein
MGQDLWCWWCCHGFEGESFGFPYKYDEKLDKFYTTGRFCSLECVKAYNLNRDSATKGINAMWILLMKKRLTSRVSPIRCAPRRESLKEFGGSISIEEFRRCKNPIMVRLPNEIRSYQTVETHVSMVPQTPTATGELVMKRPKPLTREQSALEKSLGIKKLNQK